MCLISVSSGQAAFRRSASLLDFGEGSTERLEGTGEPLVGADSMLDYWPGLQVEGEARSGGGLAAQDLRASPARLQWA